MIHIEGRKYEAGYVYYLLRKEKWDILYISLDFL